VEGTQIITGRLYKDLLITKSYELAERLYSDQLIYPS